MSLFSQPAGSPPVKKVFVKSYGCQMNVYDAERMADLLAARATTRRPPWRMRISSSSTPAISARRRPKRSIPNSAACAISRSSAKRRGPGDADRRRRLRRAGRGRGDPAPGARRRRRRRPAELSPPAGPARSAPGHGPSSTPNSRSRTSSITCRSRRAAQIRGRGVSAFLTIQEGCDKFCTFCVVPYTRGAEVSRPVARLVDEASGWRRRACANSRLIGQNVNAYHGEGPDGDDLDPGRLLHRLAEIPGIARLRYTTSHPRDMDDELIAHPPRPAGADALPAPAGAVGLRPHPRGHEPQAHGRRLPPHHRAHPRRASPDIALSSDFIVGFPGETRGGFRRDAAAGRRMSASPSSFSFKYSPRPGTPAAERADQVPEEVKAERLARLQELLETQRPAFNHGPSGRPSTFSSRSRAGFPARWPASRPTCSRCSSTPTALAVGDIVTVRIVRAGGEQPVR